MFENQKAFRKLEATMRAYWHKGLVLSLPTDLKNKKPSLPIQQARLR
jgi:hypothetical protein